MFHEEIRQFSAKIAKDIDALKARLKTEEATKQSLVIPFIKMLGYDVYSPFEVIPEYTCDIGTKKGEKIDYAILLNDEPIILIEAKQCEQNLSLHDNQLLRYFHVSKAKFGILTNGIEYRFYTDLETPNKMDEQPFLHINLLELKDEQIAELAKFQKNAFDVEAITSAASELKYTTALKNLIESEFENPSLDLVRHFTKQIYSGRITDKVCEQFREILKKSFSDTIRSLVSARLASALKKENQETVPAVKATPPGVVYISDDGKIQTTQEELDAFAIVKAILHEVIDIARISYKDGQQYFSVLLDNNSRKCFLRLHLNSKTVKYITVMDAQKNFVRYDIASISDIYSYAGQIKDALALVGNISVLRESQSASKKVSPQFSDSYAVNIFSAENPTGKKVAYMVWNGEKKEAHTLSDVYVFCMQTLFALHSSRFLHNDVLVLLKISPDSSTLRQPVKLGNGYFFESNLSSLDKFNRIKTILEICNQKESLEIAYV